MRARLMRIETPFHREGLSFPPTWFVPGHGREELVAAINEMRTHGMVQLMIEFGTYGASVTTADHAFNDDAVAAAITTFIGKLQGGPEQHDPTFVVAPLVFDDQTVSVLITRVDPEPAAEVTPKPVASGAAPMSVSDVTLEILKAIRAKPGIMFTELSELRTPGGTSALASTINQLVESEMIVNRPERGIKRYYINDKTSGG